MRHRTRVLLLCCYWLAAWPLAGRADEQAARSGLVEAIVFKLLLFVEWPENSPREAHEAFRFCVVDDGSRRPAMAELDGKRLRERTLTLLRIDRDSAGLRKCHAIFVDAANQRYLAGVAAGIHPAPVLVIAEGDQAIQHGATIGLSTAGGRLVFDVNLAAARAANLSISSKLLRIARSVFE